MERTKQKHQKKGKDGGFEMAVVEIRIVYTKTNVVD